MVGYLSAIRLFFYLPKMPWQIKKYL